jgi:hypothetical protein
MVASTLSKTMGKHLLKAGGDLRLYQLIRSELNDSNGVYDFRVGFTQQDPQQGDALSGNAFASFLLGYADNAHVSINAASDRRYPYVDLFLQDDWKISSRVSVNVGVRWDYQAPLYEADNKLVVGFDQTTPSPLQVPGLSLRGGLLFAGQNGAPRSPYTSDWNNIQPRAGLSYKITDHLVARANYGRSYLPVTGCCGGVVQTGFSQDTNMVTSVQTGIPFNTFSNPFPNGFLQPANGGQGLLTGIGTGLSFVNPKFEVPYADQWMTGVNLELPWNIGVDAAYVGNKVSKLPTTNGTAINEVPRAEREKAIEALGGNASYLSTQLPNPFAGLVNPILALNNPTISRGQLLRPNPQFNGISTILDNKGWSTYHGFELVATKRMSHGLMTSVNYTLSRLREATDYLNNGFEATPFEDLASIDRTHHITITALYELPFGPGKTFAANASGLVAGLVGGWQVNVLHEWESGTPTGMPNGIISCDPRLPGDQQTRDRWFNTSCFSSNPPNAFRTAPFRMSDVRDPAITNTALSFFKNTRVAQATLQLRFELFNPFNTRIYGGPNTTITSTQFGRITPSQINFPRTGQVGVRYVF